MLNIEKVRLLLRLDEEDIDDYALKEYISYFTSTTLARLGPSAEHNPRIYDDPIFEEAIMAAIACRLSLTDLDVIHSPTGYKVGDTEEDYQNTSGGNYGSIPSWCNTYDKLLELLSSKYHDITKVQVFRRRGMSVRPNWNKDLY